MYLIQCSRVNAYTRLETGREQTLPFPMLYTHTEKALRGSTMYQLVFEAKLALLGDSVAPSQQCRTLQPIIAPLSDLSPQKAQVLLSLESGHREQSEVWGILTG